MRNSSNGLIKLTETLVKVCTRSRILLYSCRKSKHVYKQYQHVVIVCMMKHFRLHYRSVIELLEITPELQRIIGLKRLPHYTTIHKFFRRFSLTKMELVLSHVLRRRFLINCIALQLILNINCTILQLWRKK
ncbi:MAG: hypothetical protein J7K72_04030 [Candidatus Aenigmarchaeota archaeon]|nr:hypothetical protein [Candidatus Aenigmarchaeota archaeon]